MAASSGSDVEAGFAKLQGEDFEYYMQTYSIVLGRNSKKSTVDVDLSSLGGGMNISRHHARIFYDFSRRRFALEVLGKNGCLVEGVLHLPGTPPVKLDSQDLLQIGDKEFYFLLPVRSILGGTLGPRHHVAPPPAPVPVVPPPYGYQLVGTSGSSGGKKGRGREYYMEEYEEDDDGIGGGGGGTGGGAVKKLRREGFDGYGYGGGKPGLAGSSGDLHLSGCDLAPGCLISCREKGRWTIESRQGSRQSAAFAVGGEGCGLICGNSALRRLWPWGMDAHG
ncbi:transcriptional activator FHA1 isoform X2 [Punica granatum]|uniref:Transcriptional activator FHA1 isoform X2 n=1 Tax=Punica granatum TaxID=22663 RepID=A0A6P8BSS5_PUNGR|nr:transcriptional activator FHA1 isoform X2 [Punica granatum]